MVFNITSTKKQRFLKLFLFSLQFSVMKPNRNVAKLEWTNILFYIELIFLEQQQQIFWNFERKLLKIKSVGTLEWMFLICKDIVWIYTHICEQLLAEISGIHLEPNLIELFP